MNKVTLDVIELGAQAAVSERVSQIVKFEEEIRPKLHARIIRSYLRLAGQRFEPRTFSYPSDWKEAFKARWFPEWSLRRWPVRMTTQTWSPEVVYPLIALPEEPRWEIMDLRDTESPMA